MPRSPNRLRRAAGPLVAAGALIAAAPAPATAATVFAPPCVNSTAPVTIAAAGFAPGASVALGFTGRTPVPATADALGNAAAVVPAPPTATEEATSVTASAGADVATAPIQVIFPAIAVEPRVGDAGRRVTITGRGFTSGERVYLHFRRGGRARATKRLGIAAGPCGELRSSGRLMDYRRRPDVDHDLVLATAKRFAPASTRPFGTLRVSYGGRGLDPSGNYLLLSAPWTEVGS